MVSTRRSARSIGTEPTSGAAPPTVPRRRSREALLPQSPSRGRTREIGGLHTVVTPDDKAVKQHMEVEIQGGKGKENVVVERLYEMDEDDESLEEPSGWLPDGWIMEALRDDCGSIFRYYTSPMSGYTFPSKVETLHYLFSGMDERFLESKTCAEENKLHRSHTWLPGGWVIEVRAGGKKMDKMYKFYVHLPTGKRFLLKGDVLLYANEGKVSGYDMDVLCDTSSDDNILAHLEFNPDGLPDGWVKEVIFRKCNDGIRKDPYYTDPASHHVFRTLRSVLSYLKSGEISRHAYMPRRSVTEMYSFDICADLPQSMLKRLGVEGQTKQKSMTIPVLDKEPNGQTSNHSEGGTSAGLPHSDPKGDTYNTEKTTGRKDISLDTSKRSRGRPKKIPKQTDQSTLNFDMGSHKETKHIDVKIETDITNGEGISNEKNLQCTVKEKHTAVIQKADNNLAGGNLSTGKQNDQESMTTSYLLELETDKLSKISKKVTSSIVQKFYTRRSSDQALDSNKQ